MGISDNEDIVSVAESLIPVLINPNLLPQIIDKTNVTNL
jgi:hypothetical protein